MSEQQKAVATRHPPADKAAIGTIRAVLAAEPDGEPGRLGTITEDQLGDGVVTVRVAWSSLNYKDGLAMTGKGQVVRRFPMVCGVDLAGTVIAVNDEQGDRAPGTAVPGVKVGDEVVVTGFGLGEEHFGGYADLARVRPEWVVPIPEGLDARRAMAIGTAGLTSMLCLMELERHGLTCESTSGSSIVVTGASGGVGSVAVALLAGLGYSVSAVSGRAGQPVQESYLRSLGATEVLPRSEFSDGPERPLGSERWAGGVDAVGGKVLAKILSQVRYAGCVAACGLTGGADLPTTVHPFILRGVTLAGVESVRCPLAVRATAWKRLASELDLARLDEMTIEAPLSEVPALAEEILAGRTRGRVVVAVNP